MTVISVGTQAHSEPGRLFKYIIPSSFVSNCFFWARAVKWQTSQMCLIGLFFDVKLVPSLGASLKAKS